MKMNHFTLMTVEAVAIKWNISAFMGGLNDKTFHINSYTFSCEIRLRFIECFQFFFSLKLLIKNI